MSQLPAALCISGLVCTRLSSPTCVPLLQRSTLSVVGLVCLSFGSLGCCLRQGGYVHDSPLCSGAPVGISLVPRAHCLIRAPVLELRSSAFSLFCSPSPCFAWFSKTLQLPLGSACKGAFLCMGTLPVLGLPPSLGAQALSRGSLSCPFFMSLSFLLPHSRELSLSPVPQPEA